MSLWYEKLGVISIGAQCGGPEDGGLSDMKVDLFKLFLEQVHSSACAGVAHYALALRIGGEFEDVAVEKIGPIRRNHRERYIGTDIFIPQKIWQGKTQNELRDYLAAQIRAALQGCLTRLQKDKEPMTGQTFLLEADQALERFKKINYRKKHA